MNKNRSYLDTVRGIATVLIVCFHYSSALIKYNIRGFTNYFYCYANNYWGTLGVDLFFLLSGAGLWLGYHRSFDMRTYYKRRWLKIFPMFYLGMAPLYLINALFVEKDFFYGGHPAKMLLTLIGMDGYLRSVMNNYYLIGEWFLGVIIMIYLVFPLLRKLLQTKVAAPVVTVGWLVLCYLDGQVGFSAVEGRGWLGYYMFVFWAGMLFMKYEEMLSAYARWYVCLPFMAVVFCVKLPVLWKNDLLTILLGVATLLFFMDISRRGRLPRIVEAFLKMIARYSYAIFLVHHVILDFFFKFCFSIVDGRNACLFLLLLGVVIFGCAVALDRADKMLKGWLAGRRACR